MQAPVTMGVMGPDLTSLITAALGIITLSTAAGLGLMRGTMTNLREQLADTRASNAEMRVERTEDRALIEKQKAELEALSKIVTGEIHWRAMSDLLDDHHKAAREYWQRAEGRDREMLAALRQLGPVLNHPAQGGQS